MTTWTPAPAFGAIFGADFTSVDKFVITWRTNIVVSFVAFGTVKSCVGGWDGVSADVTFRAKSERDISLPSKLIDELIF